MPPFQINILSKDLIEQVIEEALTLLIEPGVQVHNHEGLTLLAEAGAVVDFGFDLVDPTLDILF